MHSLRNSTLRSRLKPTLAIQIRRLGESVRCLRNIDAWQSRVGSWGSAPLAEIVSGLSTCATWAVGSCSCIDRCCSLLRRVRGWCRVRHRAHGSGRHSGRKAGHVRAAHTHRKSWYAPLSGWHSIRSCLLRSTKGLGICQGWAARSWCKTIGSRCWQSQSARSGWRTVHCKVACRSSRRSCRCSGHASWSAVAGRCCEARGAIARAGYIRTGLITVRCCRATHGWTRDRSCTGRGSVRGCLRG